MDNNSITMDNNSITMDDDKPSIGGNNDTSIVSNNDPSIVVEFLVKPAVLLSMAIIVLRCINSMGGGKTRKNKSKILIRGGSFDEKNIPIVVNILHDWLKEQAIKKNENLTKYITELYGNAIIKNESDACANNLKQIQSEFNEDEKNEFNNLVNKLNEVKKGGGLKSASVSRRRYRKTRK
jgi:glycine betaine/choline ABC-type transport system substrate-binding protein